jgi:tetratricopeptide (TPR) repeat protein
VRGEQRDTSLLHLTDRITIDILDPVDDPVPVELTPRECQTGPGERAGLLGIIEQVQDALSEGLRILLGYQQSSPSMLDDVRNATDRGSDNRAAVARGLYDEADRYLHRAIQHVPALREDTFYVAQLGLLDYRRGRLQTPAGRIFLANLIERQGRYTQSLRICQELTAGTPRDSAVHREALRAILRAGVYALNSQRSEAACACLEQVIRDEPCNLKANYALQLAYLRTWRRKDLERMVRRMAAVYSHFQMITNDIVLASGYENAMFAALREHDAKAAYQYLLKARNP